MTSERCPSQILIYLSLLLLLSNSSSGYNSTSTINRREVRKGGDLYASEEVYQEEGSLRKRRKVDSVHIHNWTTYDNFKVNASNSNIPNKLDYRDKKYITPVDNQGPCKACWAFAVTAAVEALMAKEMEIEAVKLSTQQLIDCTGGKNDCTGGQVTDALQYVKEHGLMTDCEYGYEAEKKACRYNANSVAYQIKSYIGFTKLNELDLKKYIATLGPGITLIYVPQSLREYRGGVYSTRTRYTKDLPEHALLIVGYSSAFGKDYWIIKNNIGPDWGEKGYFRMQRYLGLCGIGEYNVWPGA